MVDEFRRRPNSRDREALERALQKQRAYRRDEINSSLMAMAGLLAVALFMTFVLGIDDSWFRHRPAPWIKVVESGAFVAVVTTIGVFFGLPSYNPGLSRYFDRDILRTAREEIEKLQAALDGEVHVLRCDARDVVALGDDDNAAAWYAFQVTQNRIFVLDAEVPLSDADQDQFPNSAFEIISTSGDETDLLAVHCLGKRLRVRQLVPSSVLSEWDVGEQPGCLDDLIATAV